MVAATHIFRRPGLAYRLKDAAYGLDSTEATIGEVNESLMSVACIISTPTQDRVGDIVNPAGFDLTHFIKNPVVFFDHQTLPLPIGKAQDPAGNLTVKINGMNVSAVTYFAQKLPEAYQCFHLIAEGILAGTSIGFNPLEEPERIEGGEGRPSGLKYGRIELLEYSHVGIPANPDCVVLRSLLERGKIAGLKLSPAIRKSLEPFAAPRIAMANGFSFSRPYGPGKAGLEEYKMKMTKKAKASVKKAKPISKKPTNHTQDGEVGAYVSDDVADEHIEGKGGDWEEVGTESLDATQDDIPLTHKELGKAVAPHADEQDRVFFNRDSQEAHHTHAKDIAGEHLDAMKSAIEEVGTVRSLTQSDVDPPKDGSWDMVHPKHQKWVDVGDQNTTDQDSEPDDAAVKLPGEGEEGAGKKRFRRKSGIDVGDEHVEQQGGNPDAAAIQLPHSAQMAKSVLGHIQKHMKAMEPEVKTFWQGIGQKIHTHATKRFPELDFSDVGGEDGDTTTADYDGEPEQEDSSEAETEELLDQYTREPDERKSMRRKDGTVGDPDDVADQETVSEGSDADAAAIALPGEHKAILQKCYKHLAMCAGHAKGIAGILRSLEGSDEDGTAEDVDTEKVLRALKASEDKINNRMNGIDKQYFRATGKRLI